VATKKNWKKLELFISFWLKVWEKKKKKPLRNCEMHYFLFIGGFDWHGGDM
jgi:hypothetical protein